MKTPICLSARIWLVQKDELASRRTVMKTTLTNSAPGLVAVTIAAAIAFAPAASADTNPLVPYGTNPIGP